MKDSKRLKDHSERFEKKDSILILRLARKPSVNLLCPSHRELAEVNLRNPGSSSAWCGAHKVSAAAGRMFEDPGFLRFTSARHP
jgi:hypothetical protein